MRVTEERLTMLLTHAGAADESHDENPVGALVVDSIAAADPSHSKAIKATGDFFLSLVRANDENAIQLTSPVATQVLASDEGLSPTMMRYHLAEVAARDVLLSLSIHALLPPIYINRGSHLQSEQDAVVRVLYLLVRMLQAQEEADDLNRALDI